MLYPCMFWVALLLDQFVLCVCELFGETILNMFGCVCYLLLNVMDLLNVAGGALFDRPCMAFKECVCCVCDPSDRLDQYFPTGAPWSPCAPWCITKGSAGDDTYN